MALALRSTLSPPNTRTNAQVGILDVALPNGVVELHLPAGTGIGVLEQVCLFFVQVGVLSCPVLSMKPWPV